MIKYIVYPGYIHSRNDGEEHWISARQLMRLYNVNPEECFTHNSYGDKGFIELHGIDTSNLISLFPRRDGRYKNYGA